MAIQAKPDFEVALVSLANALLVVSYLMPGRGLLKMKFREESRLCIIEVPWRPILRLLRLLLNWYILSNLRLG